MLKNNKKNSLSIRELEMSMRWKKKCEQTAVKNWNYFVLLFPLRLTWCVRTRAPIWISHASSRAVQSVYGCSLRIWRKIFNKFISILFFHHGRALPMCVSRSVVSICSAINRVRDVLLLLFWPCLCDLLMTALAQFADAFVRLVLSKPTPCVRRVSNSMCFDGARSHHQQWSF